MTDLREARKAYQEIIDGREGPWCLPLGECEQMKEWFDTYALALIEALEGYEERAMERDEATNCGWQKSRRNGIKRH